MRQRLPENGLDWPELQRRMTEMAGEDANWRDGRTAVYVFNAFGKSSV